MFVCICVCVYICMYVVMMSMYILDKGSGYMTCYNNQNLDFVYMLEREVGSD